MPTFSLTTEGSTGQRKIIGTRLTTSSHSIELPQTSWSPLPMTYLHVDQTYPAEVNYHRDGTINLIKVKGSLIFRKV